MKGGTIRPITFNDLHDWRKLTCNPETNCGLNVAHFLGLVVDRDIAEELAKFYSVGIPVDDFTKIVQDAYDISLEYITIKTRGSAGKVDVLDFYLRPNQGVAMYVYYKKGCSVSAHLTVLYRTMFEEPDKKYVILDPQQEKIYHLGTFLQLNAEAAFIIVPVEEKLDEWKERYVDMSIFNYEETANIRLFLSRLEILPGITGCNELERPYGPELKFEKAQPEFNPSLAVLKNCGVLERWSKWMKQPYPLRTKYDLGCGLNVLYFLSLISYETADVEFDKLMAAECTVKGTPLTMVADAIRVEGMNALVRTYRFVLKDEISLFFETMRNDLPEGACTIVRYERWRDVGHTVIMSKKDGVLTTIDPQAVNIKKYKGVSDGMVSVMNKAGFISVSIIMLRERERERMDLESDDELEAYLSREPDIDDDDI